ncbi:hypothetical protein N2152v2_010967 [Parachlorella kessleri]
MLQPAGLSAWQRELLLRPSLVEQLTQQGVANTLLSLGTLTESDTQLARVLDVQLARQLLQHAVRFALAPSDRADLLARHAANMLYGAALLGLQPDGAQVAALLSAVQQGIRGLKEENVAQVVLASQKFIDRAEGLRQEHGLQAQRTELNPYYIYFPGNKLMGLLIKHACELTQQQRFYPRQASQILGACGSLGYLPSDLALGQLLQGMHSKTFERALAEAVQRLTPGQQVQLEFVVPDPDGQGWLRVDVALPGAQNASHEELVAGLGRYVTDHTDFMQYIRAS